MTTSANTYFSPYFDEVGLTDLNWMMDHFVCKTESPDASLSTNELNFPTNSSNTSHQSQTQIDDDKQLHLMINIPNGAFQSHQDYLQAELSDGSNSFTVTPTNDSTQNSNESTYVYYCSSANQLDPTLEPSFQVDWNKIEFTSNPDEVTSGNDASQVVLAGSTSNEWFTDTSTHNLLATTTTTPTMVVEPIVSSGSGTIRITNDIYSHPSSNSFNQFSNPQSMTGVVDPDIPTFHHSTSTSPLMPDMNIIHSNNQPLPQQVKSVASKKPQKRNQKSSGQSGSKDNRQAKPVSAYALFFRDTQASIKTENPSASFGEISKIVASKWEILRKEDKDIYKERADQERRNYLQNLASVKAKEIASTSSTNEPPSTVNLQQQLHTSDDMSRFMITSPQLIADNKPQSATSTELDFHRHSSSMSAMLDDSMSMSDSAGTLNSYNTFDYHQQSSSTSYQSALNPVMSEANAFQELSNQFGNEKTTDQSFAFNENSFFGENIIDFDLDLHILGDQHIYSPNSSFDDLSTVDYLNPPQQFASAEPTMLLSSSSSQVVANEKPFENNNNHLSSNSDPLLVESSNSLHTQQETLICVREGCQRPAIESSQWDTEFCSEECCVKYCADVFQTWRANNISKPLESLSIDNDPNQDQIKSTVALASSSA